MIHDGTRRRAFTLVELLVVVGIIAMLIAVLMPALRRARDTADRVRCSSNERQLINALLMYVNENRGYFPPAPRIYYSPDVYSFQYDYGGWIPAIAPYLGYQPDLTTYAGYTVPNRSVFFCPLPVTGSWSAGYGYRWTYSINHDLRSERKITQVQWPLGKVFAFAESGVYSDVIHAGFLSYGFYGHDYGPDIAGPAHYGLGSAVGYLDSHVEWFSTPRYADYIAGDPRQPWFHTTFWGFRGETATIYSGLGGTRTSWYDP